VGLRQAALALEVMEGRLISPPYLPIRQFDRSDRHGQVFYRNALSYERHGEAGSLPALADLLRYERHAEAWLTSLRRPGSARFAHSHFFECALVSNEQQESLPPSNLVPRTIPGVQAR